MIDDAAARPTAPRRKITLNQLPPPVYGVDVPQITGPGQMRKEGDSKANLDHLDGMERRRISSTAPSPAGAITSARDPKGRWQQGNKAGRGNPLAKQVQAIRVALVSAVAPADIQAVVQRLLQQAKDGDVMAAKVLFERTAGPAAALDLDLRLSELEDRVQSLKSEEK
ncbi:MAG: hypothetical protein ABSF26_20790 [Thermoguttaceae bacterium]|jgi:hypothetical protein